jgi:hypothetical protein
MYYLIYEIKNIINNKIYIGCHKTTNINDNYMGSGKILNYAIKKYGIENFTKTIIHLLDSEKDMFLKEKELVDDLFINRSDTYNIKTGGYGGFGYINKIISSEDKKKISINSNNKRSLTIKKLHKSGVYSKLYGETSKRLSAMHNKKQIKYDNFLNHKHTDVTKTKMSETHKIRKNHIGCKNSQYGTCWIFNLELKQNKKINKSDLVKYVLAGWTPGRKITF